jgi:hypothetical protein
MGAINFLLLVAGVFAVGLGPTRLLLKKSRFEAYTVEACFGYSSTLDVPGGQWITAQRDWNPKLLTKGNQVELLGNVPALPGACFPYRFRVGMKHSDWSCEVTMPAPGPFQTILQLPTSIAGSVVEFTLEPAQTVPHMTVNPKSMDSRDIGFLVNSLSAREELP